ncbi:Autophagy protein 7 [Rhizophlyctis rosea]|uniref:Ubiquitin-like modifier-activating enzyme ATG7 n=1 Tax=Rhizophlyctis rosea TaxID=64517 RepID=A0AAD5S5Y0_9FUNG|nr:Autophagy protein 7 [Rhizophlyctis rosea]
MSSSATLLQFEPFSSAVTSTFWHALSKNKIDLYKLDDSLVDINGYYSTGHLQGKSGDTSSTAAGTNDEAVPARLCVGDDAFGGKYVTRSAHAWNVNAIMDVNKPIALERQPTYTFSAPGFLKNTNTIEEFKGIDKAKLLKDVSNRIWDDITSGKALDQPELLTRFLLLTFADLKKYKFYYWFAFPALLPPEPIKITAVRNISAVFPAINPTRTTADIFGALSNTIAQSGSAFFLVKQNTNGDITVGKLSEWDRFWEGLNEDKRMVAFADPSALASNPGWPLRNLLVQLKKRWNVGRIKVLCFRETPGKGDVSRSIVIDVDMPGSFGDDVPKSVGWEKNTAGKLGPRLADLAPLMDPTRLADTAVDLNLKLMRWRIMPSLQLEKISETKCLLLGSGTLGCYVARGLMAWGIRHITFVDNGRVSFSNPVRQPLLNFEDCLEGGKPKAVAAAENLKKVYPGVNATAHVLSIPMPGHPIESKTRSDVEALAKLIEEHDAVFLLTDSREARWLPTVLGAASGKIVINSALGFDTFLVMRHGMRVQKDESSQADGLNLGCYFCNDVVAPADSLSDRTLDQQCTVTRPGLSAMASASAVELMVSLVNHEHGPYAAADSTKAPSEPTSLPLGLVPHQIRGFLTHFTNLLVVGHSYEKCTACSGTVLYEYKKRGSDFIVDALKSPEWLEELTGLQKLKEESEDVDVEWDADGEDDFED